MDIYAKAMEYFQYTVEMRRHFHEYPECGPEEQKETMAFVEEQLSQMDIPFVRVPEGGIFAFLTGPKEGKTVLLRADMDALPIEEDANNLVGPKVAVSKVPGVMHGCGHDGHMAMLLTEAKILGEMREQLPGTVLFMFEEGEEGHLNVRQLVRYMDEAGLRPDTCYGTHVRWDIPAGKVACYDGSAMSGLYHFELTIHGQSGHGSRPDLAHSTLDCFCQIYDAMQTLRLRYSRPDDTLTWSIGRLHAGERFNVIPDALVCEGSIRMMDRACGAEVWKEFRRILDALCPLNYCTYTLEVRQFLLPVHNNSACCQVFRRAVSKYLGEETLIDCQPWMGSDTYSFLTSMIPGIYSFVGIRNPALGSGANHHTPQFDLDESALPLGVTAAVGYVLEYFRAPADTSDFVPVEKDMKSLIAMLNAS